MVRDDDMLVNIWNLIYIIQHPAEDGTLPYLQQGLRKVLGQLSQSGGVTRCNHYILHITLK